MIFITDFSLNRSFYLFPLLPFICDTSQLHGLLHVVCLSTFGFLSFLIFISGTESSINRYFKFLLVLSAPTNWLCLRVI